MLINLFIALLTSSLGLGAVQLLRNALGGGMGRPGVTLCDRGRGSAERYVTPKIIYMYNIYYKFYCHVCSFIYIYTCISINMYTYIVTIPIIYYICMI